MIILLINLILFHPFHVSVTQIDLDTERKALEISTSIFVDDLEKAIVEKGGPELKLGTRFEIPDAERYVKNYLKSQFDLYINGKAEEWEFLGYELENGAVWSYIQVLKVKKVETLTVTNRTLLETFSDQENIIHVQVNDQKKSSIINDDRLQASFEFR